MPKRPEPVWLPLVLRRAEPASRPSVACGLLRSAGSNVKLNPRAFSSPRASSLMARLAMPPDSALSLSTRTVRDARIIKIVVWN